MSKMRLSKTEILLLQDSAIKAAKLAAKYIESVDRSQLTIDHKTGGRSLASQVVTQVDIECQRLILDELEPITSQYQFAVLAEENANEDKVHDHARYQADYFWCIDPLDGTLPFIEGGQGYAVSIALVANNGEPCLGVVVNPKTMQIYTVNDTGLGKNVEDDQWLHLYIDRSFKSDTRFSSFTSKIKEIASKQNLQGIIVHDGSGAVMNAIGGLNHQHSCYIKLPKPQKGGGCLWDFAATAAIYNEFSTASVSDCLGNRLNLNQGNSHFMNLNGVAYSNGLNHTQLLNAMSQLLGR